MPGRPRSPCRAYGNSRVQNRVSGAPERPCGGCPRAFPDEVNRTYARTSECTIKVMDVAVTDLRAHLSEWLDRARAGGEVVITDRGVPVARLLGLTATATLERLTDEGVIGRPASVRRPAASGRPRPRPRRPLSEIVSDQRR